MVMNVASFIHPSEGRKSAGGAHASQESAASRKSVGRNGNQARRAGSGRQLTGIDRSKMTAMTVTFHLSAGITSMKNGCAGRNK